MVTGRGAGVVDEVLRRRGRSRQVALRIPYFLAAPAIIAATNLVLTIPRAPAQVFAARWPLRVVPPPIPLPSGTVHMWWHERFDNDPAHQWLREQVVAAARADR
jgi:DNA-binding transcriptional LysR family regulator